MKAFQSFLLDTSNQCLWRGQERVPIAPKAYDILRYLVENPARLVTCDEVLEKLWPDTFVNPEILRKYILDIRKALGDRAERPEFIETVPKRGYRFIAPVTDEIPVQPAEVTAAAASPVLTSVSSQKNSPAPHYLRKVFALVILTIVVAAAATGRFWLGRTGLIRPTLSTNSIAVLPFADMSSGHDQEYFSDGLTEELINELAKVPGLKVVARSSAFQFKGKNEDLRSVGRKLGVANVLEGSVRREGNRIRITAALTKANDGFQLWSQTYERQIDDIFAVQDEIARAATQALQLKLLASEGPLVTPGSRSANPKAYQAYLQANYLMAQGHSKDALSTALAYTDQAIQLDPNYAPAWALRSRVRNRMAGFSLIDINEGTRLARNDAEHAIALDPGSPSGYIALARIQNDHDWDWNGASVSMAKAAALEPGSAEAVRFRSYLARQLGDLDEAIKLYRQAVALDPLRTDFRLGFGYQLYVAGRYEEAQQELQKCLDLSPQAAFVHSTRALILLATGKPQQALGEIELEPSDWGKLTGEALVYHALGREQESNTALATLISTHQSDSAYQIAQVYAFRGESEKSLDWLERAYDQRDGGLTDIKTDPFLKVLHHNPRYTALLKNMRLP